MTDVQQPGYYARLIHQILEEANRANLRALSPDRYTNIMQMCTMNAILELSLAVHAVADAIRQTQPH